MLARLVVAVTLTGCALESAPCLSSGTDVTLQGALAGERSVSLCPGSVFELQAPVKLGEGQQLITRGSPAAVLRVRGASQTTAIDGQGVSDVLLENLEVDGNRAGLGALDGEALIRLGGSASGQVVRQVWVHDPRSWSALHFHEGVVTRGEPSCQRATVVDSHVGPAGTPDRWADGISLACGNSVVTGNLVEDATDGAIVLFGAPGSRVEGNTIVAKTRRLLGGINLVDAAQTGGNFRGTQVVNNRIVAEGAFIHVGIAMGAALWSCVSARIEGGTVVGNRLEGAHFGYGYAVHDVRDFVVRDNVDASVHVGVPGFDCAGRRVAVPSGFQVASAIDTELQNEFVPASLGYLHSVTEPARIR